MVEGGLFVTVLGLAHGNIPLALVGTAAVIVGAMLASFGTTRLLKANTSKSDDGLHKEKGTGKDNPLTHPITACSSALFCCKGIERKVISKTPNIVSLPPLEN